MTPDQMCEIIIQLIYIVKKHRIAILADPDRFCKLVRDRNKDLSLPELPLPLHVGCQSI